MAPGELLLDIGSGFGRVLDYLEKKGFTHVFGLENNFRFLEKSHFSVVCGKGEQAPFKDESFGAIFSIGVFSYILEDSKRVQFLNEIHRILKPQGLLFLSCFMISGDEYHQKKYREGRTKYGTHGIFESDSGGIYRHSNEKELREILHKFHILSWKQRPFITMNKRMASGVITETQKQKRASEVLNCVI
ncbi:MAG TPA: class I SAM-dependent methyltransferase [Candidatus Heimdallarchaeota archaeon]|nr:class I SAM-dependent methyltransferase [Candidatus Heimdallarchaeota archaeon]